MNQDERIPLNISSDQLALEREMATRGIERYRANQATVQGLGRISVSTPGRKLVLSSLEIMVEKIEEWLEGEADKPGRRHQSVEILASIDPYAAAAMTVQTMLDAAAHGVKRSTLICQVATAIRDEAMLGHMRDTHHPLFERLHGFNIPRHMRTSVARRWARQGIWEYDSPLRNDQVQAGLVLFLLAMDNTGLFQQQTLKTKDRTHVQIHLKPDALKWMEKVHESHEALTPVYLPMVQEPLDWGLNQVGGYRSNMARRRPLCRLQRASHAATIREADMPEIYRAVNLCQKTPWRVNTAVYEIAKTLWDSNAQIGGMPDRNAPEFPERPDEKDELDLRQWKGMKSEALARFKEEGSTRLRYARTLDMAGRFVGKTIYYPQFLDWRGRMYPVPAWLNHQGPDFARSLLLFDRSCRLEYGSPEAELFVEYGHGLWKGEIPDGLVEAVAENPLDVTEWQNADEPWQFLAWCLEADKWGEDEGTPIRVPVLCDGTNNGLQIYSLLMRDPELARITNVSPSEEKVDAYQIVADKVWDRLKADPSEDARKWRFLLVDGIPRDAVKRPVMASPYGIRKHSAMGYIRTWLLKLQEQKKEFPWGHSTFKPAMLFADLVWEEVQNVIEPATRCMDWLKAVSDEVRGPIRWTNPAGFPICQDYPKLVKRQVKAALADTVRFVRFHGERTETSTREQRDGLPPNFVHSLDSAALCLTINRCADAGLQDFHMVHDSYGTTAQDAPVMARVLRETFADIFQEDLLTSFAEEVSLYSPEANIPAPPERGTLDPSVVLDSKHFFG